MNLAALAERSFSISEIPYFISGDAGPTGTGGRGVSPVDAGGSGRSRSEIDPLEGGEHAPVLVGRRRLRGRADLERGRS